MAAPRTRLVVVHVRYRSPVQVSALSIEVLAAPPIQDVQEHDRRLFSRVVRVNDCSKQHFPEEAIRLPDRFPIA
jgi:hypothetical protein